jgi:SWI/SNF-related matrix-associated actin-dependent regulator of chromatin subfamily E protein 1
MLQVASTFLFPLSADMVNPPKAPEKPLSAYMRFSKKIWDSVRAEHPDLKLWELGTIIGAKWRELAPPEKSIFQDAWGSEKVGNSTYY